MNALFFNEYPLQGMFSHNSDFLSFKPSNVRVLAIRQAFNITSLSGRCQEVVHQYASCYTDIQAINALWQGIVGSYSDKF